VTRTLSLHGEGLGAEQLPELATWPVNGIKEYGDQPITRTTTDNASVHGIREQRIALVPGAEGSYRLPEIRIPWSSVAGPVRGAPGPVAGNAAGLAPQPAHRGGWA
jgi:hypothetical protein